MDVVGGGDAARAEPASRGKLEVEVEGTRQFGSARWALLQFFKY